ncbi:MULTISPECIES: site-specific integrase [unclassified Pseudonocardia]|uniref:site-specific integrase n=1 Tax=unclassified Pseudonocardia TaxID=2619320 RepID=UPI0011153BE5|nr:MULTISPECIES: site-specific integrase [unclassified Pseudonocardia]
MPYPAMPSFRADNVAVTDDVETRSFGAASSSRPGPGSGLLVASGEPELTAAEAGYVTAARAANTRRGYRSVWTGFTAFCRAHDLEPMPAAPATVSGYLVALAQAGMRTGTIAKHLSAIRAAHRAADQPDPAVTARVTAVWEGIRRTHGAPPKQAAPLMPPLLDHAVAACPTIRSCAGRDDEPDLAGARDRALLLVGFSAALRRSELAALTVAQIGPEQLLRSGRRGRVLTLPRSKTNQTGETVEFVGLTRTERPGHCPLTALEDWLTLAGITSGPVLRKVSTGNRATTAALHPESVNTLVKAATARAGLPGPYSAHSLRAGFVTYAHLRGASDRAIAHQTRHRSMDTITTYVRVDDVFENNAVTQLGR